MTNETNNYIEEVLEEWLNKQQGVYARNNNTVCLDGTFSLKELLDQALLKQTEIIKECLPVVKKATGFIEMTFAIHRGDRKERATVEDNYDLGWNECRQQFLDNLKSRGINLE
jgi:hypothetical protein